MYALFLAIVSLCMMMENNFFVVEERRNTREWETRGKRYEKLQTNKNQVSQK